MGEEILVASDLRMSTVAMALISVDS